MLLILLILCVALSVLWYLYLHFVKYSDVWKLPGPSLLSMFSSLGTETDLFNAMIALNRIYGPVVKLWTNPLKPMLVVSSPKFIEYLLTFNVHLDKSKFYEFFETYEKGIVSLEASAWKTQRKLLNPAFHNKILEDYVQAFEKFGKDLVSELRGHLKDDFVDLHLITYLHTLKCILATVMNLNEGFDEATCMEFNQAREQYFRLGVENAFSVAGRNKFLLRLTRSYQEQERHGRVLNRFSSLILNAYNRQKVNGRTDDKTAHLIDYLLEEYDFGSKELLNEISTFTVAGQETVSTVLNFTLYELSKRQDVQRKLVEESTSILGDAKTAEASFNDLQQMKYLDCVIKECVRLYTPVPFFDRTIKEDAVIDGVRIPKGTYVSMCAYNVHHSAENFPEPLKFDPDRFLPDNAHKLKPFTFIPFSLGPRNCIGKQFAMLELKSTLTKILRHFELWPAGRGHEIKLCMTFTLKSTTGTPVRLKLRQD